MTQSLGDDAGDKGGSDAGCNGSASDPARASRPRRGVPACVIALLFAALLAVAGNWDSLRGSHQSRVAAALQALALFLPGAVKRARWRHVLAMLLLFFGYALAQYGLGKLVPTLAYPYESLWRTALLIAAVGFGEFVLVRPGRARSLTWVLLSCLGVAFIYHALRRCIQMTDFWIWVPWGSPHWAVSFHDVVRYPLLALLTWIAVPIGLRAAARAARKARCLILTAAPASIAVFLLYACVLIYPLAQWTIRCRGPLYRSHALWVLAQRAREEDIRSMWGALENADWTQRIPPSLASDWRCPCINFLARRDPKRAAARLSRILRSDPSERLTRFAAGILAEEERYETVPILMRYTLCGLVSLRGHGADCTSELAAMGVPQAAIAILMRAGSYEDLANLRLDPLDRERLRKVLGRDAGPDYRSWSKLYDDTIHECPTPLSQSQRDETNRVIACFWTYILGREALRDNRIWHLIKRLRENGKGSLARALAAAAQRPPGEARAAIRTLDPTVLDSYLQRVWRDVEAMEPNWDVVTTDDLEREMDEYLERVNAFLATCSPTTAPATRPE